MVKKMKVVILAVLCIGLIIGCGKSDSGGDQPTGIGVVGHFPDSRSEPIESVAEEVSVSVTDTDSDTLEISEKMFLTQINDIYNNFDLYKDKTVIVEGIYAEFISGDETETAPVVFRYGPGCCGNDGWGGFLLHYDGEFPAEDSWIRVTGTPELVTSEAGFTDLYLNVNSLVVKEERGEEYMLQ